MRTEPSSRERSSGFSLIEMLVVVAIAMILAATGLPILVSVVRSYKIQGATKQMVGELQTARGKAIMTNAHRGVSFVIVDDDSYRYVQEDLDQDDDQPRSPLLDLPQGVRFIPTGVAGSSPSVRFENLGGFCNTATVTGTCTKAGVTVICVGPTDKFCGCTSTEAPKRCTTHAGENFFAPDGPTTGGVDGGLYVQLAEETTGLRRRVHIAPGGRIRAGQGQND